MTLSAKQRQQVHDRDVWCCVRCGAYCPPGARNIHHRTPRGMGGTTDPRIDAPANLLLVCGTGTTGCHGWIESNRAEAYQLGYLVRRGTDPATVAVHRWSRPVQLTDTGWATEYRPTSPAPADVF